MLRWRSRFRLFHYRHYLLIAVSTLLIFIFLITIIRSFGDDEVENNDDGQMSAFGRFNKTRYSDGLRFANRRSISSSSCYCVDDRTSIAYDFCYKLIDNVTVFGKRFSCEWIWALRDLNLLDTDKKFFRLDNDTLPSVPTFVSAASKTHFDEALRLVSNLQVFFPESRLIFYDIGLTVDQAMRIRTLCQVDYRRFDFNKYPPSIKMLYDYRWKPLVIASALKEFSSIWYLDSSVTFGNGNLTRVHGLLNCHADHKTTMNLIRDVMMESSTDAGFDLKQWLIAINRCDKFPYLLQGFTGHGIFSATDPYVYEYIPTNLTKLKRESSKMFEAGFAFIVRTKDVVHKILKWYVLCALEEHCMAPFRAQASCEFMVGDKYGIYAKCHRFDQSVVNLLLANANGYDSYYWSSGVSDFFRIVRGQIDSEPTVQTCLRDAHL